jgi:hypothetical protein
MEGQTKMEIISCKMLVHVLESGLPSFWAVDS